VKSWFPKFSFKFNLYRYNEGVFSHVTAFRPIDPHGTFMCKLNFMPHAVGMYKLNPVDP
jgi:hypothetical protein